MADETTERKAIQETQPKGRDRDGNPYESVEIPVPTEGDVMGLFEKVAHAPVEVADRPSSP
jgi:hypothetical protein